MPIIALLAIAPLIVRFKLVYPSEAVAVVIKETQIVDVFSQNKAAYITAIMVIMLILLFFFFDKKEIKKDKHILFYSISCSVFLLFSLLSTFASSYQDVAVWGLPDRAEGMVVIACYGLMFLYTVYVFNNTQDYKYIAACLLLVIGVNTILGAFQYFGNDLYNTVLRNVIMPKEIASKASIDLAYEEGKVYGTMFHYNYMGSFGAMMVPLFAVLTILIKDIKAKITGGAATLASLFLLFGSTSRAGLIGLALAFLIGLIVFGKFMVKRWKLMLPLVAVFAVILVAFNFITKGTIFSRIPTLVNDAFGIFMPSDQSFDYKDHIPVRDIITKDGKVYITLQSKEQLALGYANKTLEFYDGSGNKVDYTLNGDVFQTADSRFAHLSFNLIALDEDETVKNGALICINNMPMFMVRIDQQAGVYLADTFTAEKIEIEYPETFGFKGKERLGSARGYIWSRSIPMLKDTILIGYGPDVFAMKFPQRDYLGKYYAYDTPNMIVDKPHNLYLQIGINQGIIALLAFLALTLGYIAESIKLYALKDTYASKEAMGIATMLSIVGYLGAGFFNDSIVSVAPIFWILLGTGVAINYLVKKERRLIQSKLEHATIDMKTKKYIKKHNKKAAN